jgi:hypothetical protein
MTEFYIDSLAITDIPLDHPGYKISRNYIDPLFQKSIAVKGVLEPVSLLDQNGDLKVIFGLNRLRTASFCGHDSVKCYIYGKIDPEIYYAAAVLKSYRGEIGAVGRLKLLNILTDATGICSCRDISSIACDFGIPREFIDEKLRSIILSEFSSDLLDYIDLKDPGFKYIKMLTMIPADVREKISCAAGIAVMKVNVFRACVEMSYDICVRDGNSSSITKLNFDPLKSIRETGENFHRELYRLRYPSYSEILHEVEILLKKTGSTDVIIDFPANLERDHLIISFKASRGAVPEEALKVLGVDKSVVERLLSFL